MTEEWLTVRQAATLLRVSESYIRNSAVPKHRLPPARPTSASGRCRVRIRRADLEAWVARHGTRVA